MVIKSGVFLVGAIVESTVQEFLIGNMGKNRKYKERTLRLLNDETISTSLQTDLDWIWDIRNNQHLFLVMTPEFGHYSKDDYNRAVNALYELFDALK